MNVEDFCYHTFLRWVNMIAHCAVCNKRFDFDYDNHFIGTFPRADIEYMHRPTAVNSTSTVIIPTTWRLDL